MTQNERGPESRARRHFTLLVFASILLAHGAEARPLHVGPGRQYARLRDAAAAAMPGDTIMVHAGVYGGVEYIEDLRGREDAWITICAVPGDTVVYRGGTEALHLTDPAWVRIAGIVFEGQSGNGVNIDDGGSYETPASHVLIEDCEWRALAANGNNDQLKLSGVDSFMVRRCRFFDGSPGGSAVDMVGCHRGVFEDNHFENAGSNCIQAKGGTAFIRIERNRFINGGQRALNIGGSTGLQYFRPLGMNYEAADIGVYANLFAGSTVPVAFVGAVRGEVVNNTIYMPGKWVIRILQETVGPDFLPCGDNAFRNNLVCLGAAAADPSVNIGGNTSPETFEFSNNLWFNADDPAWRGPNLPVSERGGVSGRDPLLADGRNLDFTLRGGSPAIGAGGDAPRPDSDFAGRPFARPRSIGAFEGAPTASAAGERPADRKLKAVVFPNPSTGEFTASFDLDAEQKVEILLRDIGGRETERVFEGVMRAGRHLIGFRPSCGINAALFCEIRTPLARAVMLLGMLQP